MGKRSQHKKELRAQRKGRENKKIEINPASIPIKASLTRPQGPTLLSIPLEIRYKIYAALANGTHTITIAPDLHIYSPLTGLTDSHLQLENEIAEWRKCYTSPAIHPVFGAFDPAITTFKITFRSNEQKVTRVYDPEEAQTKMLNLELWKRAMDMVHTNKQFVVNLGIRYLSKRLWAWKPMMSYQKRGTVEFQSMQGKLRYLLFDEERHGNVPVMQLPRRYEEPFDKKMPDVKIPLKYRKKYHTGTEVACYYRSLGVDVSNMELRVLERAVASREVDDTCSEIDELVEEAIVKEISSSEVLSSWRFRGRPRFIDTSTVSYSWYDPPDTF